MLRFILVFLFASSSLWAKSNCFKKGKSYDFNFSFSATTNMPGVGVEGELKEKQKIKLQEKQTLTIALAKLVTGMDSRDEHMRDEVFAKTAPAIEIKKLDCENAEVAVLINKVAQTYNLKFQKNGDAWVSESSMSLAKHKIKAPEKFGVKVKDTIKLKVKLQ